MLSLSMVQIDVPLAFCLGATLALIARDVLVNEARPWSNPYLYRGLLVCSLTIIPIGVYYLWSFPYWDTMYMFSPAETTGYGPAAGIPGELVLVFVILLVIASFAGFALAHRLIMRGGLFVPILVPSLVFAAVCAFCGIYSDRMFFVGSYEEFHAGERVTSDEIWVLWNRTGIFTAIVMIVGVGSWALYIRRRVLAERAHSG